MSVEIAIKPNGEFASIIYKANGTAYDRGKQYDWKNSQDGNGQHYWTGTLRTNPDVVISGSLIPKVMTADRREPSRFANPMEVIVSGWAMSFRQAAHAAIYDGVVVFEDRVFESQFYQRRVLCQTFSTGFSSGAREGRKIGVMLSGTSSLLVDVPSGSVEDENGVGSLRRRCVRFRRG